MDLINQAIQDNEDFQTYRQKTKLILSNGKSFFQEIPKIMDTQRRTAFQLQDEIKSIGISHELAYLLDFVYHPKHGIPFITMNKSSKHALLSTHQRPPNGGIFCYFLHCDLRVSQLIGNQRAPLMRITPAVENITSNVKSIQFEHLYYYRLSKDIIMHIGPEIRSEFGKLIQFKHSDPMYMFHFHPSILENTSIILILQCSYSHLIMLDPIIAPTFNPELYYNHQLKGNTHHYPIYQSGGGLGSKLFNIVKSVCAPVLKDVILPSIKQEAGQVLKDITSSVSAKRAGKFILKHGTNVSYKAKKEHVTLFANENGTRILLQLYPCC